MARHLLHLLAVPFFAGLLLLMVLTPGTFASLRLQSDGQLYQVQPGDSLFEIAEDFYGNGRLWPRIVEATNAVAATDPSYAVISNPDMLRVGQKLWIPSEAAIAQTEQEGADGPSVRFVRPLDGATVPPTVEIETAATGLTVEEAGEVREGAGHMHILVDADFIPAGEIIPRDDEYIHYWQGQLTGTLELEPGQHVLRLQFSDGAHFALDGEEYRDTITITVAATGTTVSDSAPAVRFVRPLDGATVPPTFEIETEAVGLTVEEAGEVHPGAGHMHILVDADFIPAGEIIPRDDEYIHYWQGQLTGTLELEPGQHVLRLQFSDGAHFALEGEQYRDTVTVTVSSDAAAVPTMTEGQPSVRFVSPLDGATVPPAVEIEVAATGLTVEEAGEVREGAGHMHILVDTDFVPAGEIIPRDDEYIHYWQGQLTGTLELEPGEHILRLQFSDGAHFALEGEAYRDTITITVAATTTSATDAGPSVRFVSPVDGATVSPTVEIEVAATALVVEEAGEVREGAGHMHILVDTDFVPAGEIIPRDDEYIHYWQGQLTGTLELEPGEHVLHLQFSDGAHFALEGEQYRDTVTITVAE